MKDGKPLTFLYTIYIYVYSNYPKMRKEHLKGAEEIISRVHRVRNSLFLLTKAKNVVLTWPQNTQRVLP